MRFFAIETIRKLLADCLLQPNVVIRRGDVWPRRLSVMKKRKTKKRSAFDSISHCQSDKAGCRQDDGDDEDYGTSTLPSLPPCSTCVISICMRFEPNCPNGGAVCLPTTEKEELCCNRLVFTRADCASVSVTTDQALTGG